MYGAFIITYSALSSIVRAGKKLFCPDIDEKLILCFNLHI